MTRGGKRYNTLESTRANALCVWLCSGGATHSMLNMSKTQERRYLFYETFGNIHIFLSLESKSHSCICCCECTHSLTRLFDVHTASQAVVKQLPLYRLVMNTFYITTNKRKKELLLRVRLMVIPFAVDRKLGVRSLAHCTAPCSKNTVSE